MANVFPIYRNHKSARCFKCRMLLKDNAPEYTDYPDGKWKRLCPKCGFWTWYDVGPNTKDGGPRFSQERVVVGWE